MAVTVHPFALASAGDPTGLEAALRQPEAMAARRLVLLAKVPGPATLNDSARELAQLVFRQAILQAGGAGLLDRCRLIVSVGCEGVGSAGGWLLAEDGLQGGGAPRLALGTAETPTIPDAMRGTPAHVAAVATATAAAMTEAGLDCSDVRLVLVKSPVRRDQPDATGRSRGAAALGVAVALGQLPAGMIDDAAIGDPALFCTRAMAMSGTETGRAELVVLGNRPGAGGALSIEADLLEDVIDIGGARRLLRRLGAGFDADGVLARMSPLSLVLFKAGSRPDGLLRGRRTEMHGTDMPADKHLRAAASGMLAALLGSNDAFITGGAEHQAPVGGCLVAAIGRA